MTADLQRPVRALTVRAAGNRVDIACGDIRYFFEAEGIDLPADVDPSFAAFSIAPVAMRHGFDVAFEAPVDPTVIENVNRLAEVWSIWRPRRYQAVRFTAPDGWRRAARPRNGDLRLYSGGVDSTFPMVVEGRREPASHALTLRSMDYKQSSDETFRRFVAKTDPLARHLNYRRVFLRTDLILARLDPASHNEGSGSWAFLLAATLFLFSDLFETGAIAADYSEVEDLTLLSSNNHVSNRYFAGSDFRIDTLGSDTLRIDKVAAIAQSPEALQSLTFCTIESSKPENCGRCPKCIRTKAMFMATTGDVPPIFADRTLTRLQLTRFNFAHHSHLSFFRQIVRTAERTGTLDRLPGLAEAVARGSSIPNRIRAMINRVLVEKGYG